MYKDKNVKSPILVKKTHCASLEMTLSEDITLLVQLCFHSIDGIGAHATNTPCLSLNKL